MIFIAGSTAATQSDIDSASAAQADMEEEEDEISGEAAIQAVLTGAIAKVVYKSAIDAIPDQIEFRHNFLKLLSQFKFEGIAVIQDTILDSIQRDFGDTEEAWDLKARAGSGSQASIPQVWCQPRHVVMHMHHMAMHSVLLCCPSYALQEHTTLHDSLQSTCGLTVLDQAQAACVLLKCCCKTLTNQQRHSTAPLLHCLQPIVVCSCNGLPVIVQSLL